jgi:histidinol-phosphate/aromatic aminotransferase/cobyric acid decarboxylase-like protein
MSVFPSNANFVLTKGSAAQQLGQYVYEQGFKPRFYDEQVMKDGNTDILSATCVSNICFN